MARTMPKLWVGELIVRDLIVETPSVKTLRLGHIDVGEPIPFDFIPGQFVQFHVTMNGEVVRRSMTIASSPTEKNFIDITVKKEEKGLVSPYLCDEVQIGDRLTLKGPYGKFCFTGEEADSIVLVGGGVGITPLITVVRYLLAIKWPNPIYIVFSFKTLEEYIYRQEIEAYQKLGGNLNVFITMTREHEDRWHGAHGRINGQTLIEHVPELTSRRVHVCGPDAMMADIRETCAKLGMDKSQVKFESF